LDWNIGRIPFLRQYKERIILSKPASSSARRGPPIAGPDEQRDNEDSFALLKALAEASAVFVAFTFIGGWSYLASCYSAFGLNPLELDVPVPVVCTTAIYVLFDAKWPLIVVAALILGWVVYAPHFRRLARSVGAAVLGLLLLTVSTGGVIDGRDRAGKDAVTDTSALPFVAFSLKLPKTDQPSCVDFQTYGSVDCNAIVALKKHLLFLRADPKCGGGQSECLHPFGFRRGRRTHFEGTG
jgi:hypothetical protein